MKYNTIEIGVSSECTICCEMCLFSCSTTPKTNLPTEIIMKIIDSASLNKDITHIVFSGGEPFIELHRLCNMIEYTTRKGLQSICLTNAFWCSDYEKTLLNLQQLKARGLTEIIVSADAYHQKYIPLQNVVNLLMGAETINLATQVTVVNDAKTHIQNASIVKQIADYFENQKIAIVPRLPYTFVNNTFQKVDEIKLQETDSAQLQCLFDTRLYVHYTGNVYPCCLFLATNNPDLILGSVYNDDFSVIMEKANKSSIIDCIQHIGPERLVKFNNDTQNKGYVNGCDCCISALSNLKTWGKIKRITAIVDRRE